MTLTMKMTNAEYAKYMEDHSIPLKDKLEFIQQRINGCDYYENSERYLEEMREELLLDAFNS